MDVKQELLKKFKGGKVAKVIAIVLAAVTVLAVALSFLPSGEHLSDAKAFIPLEGEVKQGDLVYLDIVGLDDWTYKVDSTVYYVAWDYENMAYAVIVPNKDLKKMGDQRDYSDNNFEGPMPKPYRIYGTATKVSKEVKEAFMEVYSLTSEEFEKYLGFYLLNGNSTPGENQKYIFLMIALFAGLFALVFFIVAHNSRGGLKKSLAELTDEEAMKVNDIIEGLDKEKLVFTDEYIISRGTAPFVVKYSDILLSYVRVQRYNFVPIGRFLVLNCKNKKAYQIECNKKNPAEGYLEIVAEKNPDMMIGYTKENLKAYAEMCKNR